MEGKNIDKLFKDRLGENKVPYDPTNWERMSTFLDENPIKRPIYVWDYIIAAALLIVVIGISIFYYVKIQSQIHESNSVHEASKDITLSEEKITLQKSISNQELLITEEVASKSGSSILENSNLSQTINSSIEEAESTSSFKARNDNAVVEGHDGFDAAYENYSSGIKNNSAKKITNTGKSKVKSSIIYEEDHDFDADGAFDSGIASNNNDLRNSMVEEVDPIQNSMPEELTSLFQVVDLSINSNNSKWYRISKKPKPFLDAFLGTGFMSKPDYLLVKGGISIGLDLNPNLFVRTGITFASQNTPRHAGYSYEKTVFGFGSDLDVYELEVQKTNSMSIPMEIGFRKNRHVIFAGVEVEKILASKGEFHLNLAGDARILKEKGWIGNKAFLPEPTWNFLLGYEYYIGPRTIIGARIESAMSNYINSNEVEEFRSPGASNWGRAILQIRQKF